MPWESCKTESRWLERPFLLRKRTKYFFSKTHTHKGKIVCKYIYEYPRVSCLWIFFYVKKLLFLGYLHIDPK